MTIPKKFLIKWIAIAGLSFPLINSFKGKAFNSPYKIDFSNMSVAEKMKTLELLSVDRQQFNELITEYEETINSIIIEKENKDSKAKKLHNLSSYSCSWDRCSTIHVAYNSL